MHSECLNPKLGPVYTRWKTYAQNPTVNFIKSDGLDQFMDMVVKSSLIKFSTTIYVNLGISFLSLLLVRCCNIGFYLNRRTKEEKN